MLSSETQDCIKLKHRVSIKKELISLFIGLSLTFIGLIFLYQLWNFHPRVPILYSGDGLLTLNGLRNMRLGNWYWSTQNLGAPFGQDLRDFPAIAENFHLIMLWLGVKILRSEVLAFNLFFFGTYLFTTTFGYIGSRLIRLNRSTAVLVGVIYSFLPFHYQHGPGHLYLAAYWALPIWIAFLVRELMGDSMSPFSQGSKLDWCRNRSTFHIAIIAIVAATTGLYYSFFFIILASFVLCLRRLKQTISFEWVPLLFAIVLASTVMAIQYFPIWLYQRQNGSNLSIVKRSISEVEYYSLKIINLVLPINGHRISLFNEIRVRANPVYLIGEGADALGLFGSIGLVILLVILVLQTTSDQNKVLASLSVFTFIALLISTVGGFTQIVAAFGFSQLRVGSRMSVVIAFPAIVSAAICLERLFRHRKRGVMLASILIIGSLSVLDMNPGNQLPPYKAVAQSWERDRNIVTRVSTSFGKDAMIFQLPVIPFPENPPVVNMTDYEHLKGYLHSPSLRWSYGGVKGRSADWQLSLPTDPKLLISKLQQQNFQVIWINRNGYEDRGTRLFNQLKDLGLKLFFKDSNLFILDLSKHND